MALRCNGGMIDVCVRNCNHNNKRYGVSSFPYALGLPSLKFVSVALKSPSSPSSKEFFGRVVVSRVEERKVFRSGTSRVAATALAAQMTIGIRNAPKWWEKGLQPNMKEIVNAQDLVDSLLNTGDKLVIVDFFSPGCGGCRALHPKICQLAEMNPNVQFLQVNYEELKPMCYALNVHVLPFFRFYRGAHGRLCSFSCTNATIKKFKDALAKHSPDRCSLGPPKGLEEKELLALAANKDLSFNYTPKPAEQMSVPPPSREEISAEVVTSELNSEPAIPLPLPRPLKSAKTSPAAEEERSLISPGR